MVENPDGSQPDDPIDDADVRDTLPEDLNAAGFVGPYLFPNNSRRRIPGFIYILMGAGCLALWAWAGDEAVLVNDGIAIAGAVLIAVGLYHLQAGWDLAVDENEALVQASRSAGFAIGHASAQLGWRGLRSRPTWKVLAYSHESPPLQRAMLMVDGIDGEIIDRFVEDNPEDWTGLEA